MGSYWSWYWLLVDNNDDDDDDDDDWIDDWEMSSGLLIVNCDTNCVMDC